MAYESEEPDDTSVPKDDKSSREEGETMDDDGETVESDGEDEEDDEEGDEEEPKLKYARLTSYLGPVYRNGDATSAFMVAGDKMFVGTHSGIIHVVSLPSFQSLRVYQAHTASVSSISISPFPPPRPSGVPEGIKRVVSQSQTPKRTSSIASKASTSSPQTPRAQAVPNTASNAIYIATSSIDGKVCVASLVDIKDVQLRDFARPVQAVALSPEYKSDRTYISGGLAGNLVLTVGGRAGTSTISTTTGTAAAAASGWLGTIGLGSNSGKDTVLHSGEGAISTIKWSLTGRYVVWINEHGAKIMRSNLHLESADSESAWKRIAHVDRPQGEGWEEMAGVWKGRVEWIDEKNLETDDGDHAREVSAPSPATMRLRQQASNNNSRIEKLLIGWGGTVWIINVHPGGVGVGKNAGERSVGQAEIIKILRMDCIISGLSLYTPTLLLVLAYITPEDEEEEEDGKENPKGHKSKLSTTSTGSEPRGGIRHRQNALSPELRLIDLNSSQEVDTDTLTVSRFERLSATDYHLGILPDANTPPFAPTSRGAFEALSGMGSGMWNATVNATALLSSAASIRSNSSKGSDTKPPSTSNTARTRPGSKGKPIHPHVEARGMKIFIHSPYDCILATKRELSDHLSWLLEREKYQEAWQLVDKHPEIISMSPEKLAELVPSTPDRAQASSDDFYDDNASTVDSASKLINTAVEKEKRRIGELWIQQLIKEDDWVSAGKVCGKVLGTAQQWEEWVYVFVGARKFDEITSYIPTTQLKPPLPSQIYEVLLAHYVGHNRPRVRELLELWSTDLFDIKSVTTVLENQLKYRDVREDSVEDGQVGRDWRIVMESLGKLHIADGRPREALKCYIRLQDADTAMGLIRDYHLVDAVADDIPSLILLRVSKEQKRSASIKELRDATSEAIELLVDEARHGIVHPDVVVEQLEKKNMTLYLYFYLSALWNGDGIVETQGDSRERLIAESKSLVNDLADLAIQLFAQYNRDLLMDVLKSSTFYTFEKATHECEERDYIPELVYLYSKTGQTKRALYLIIDRLADVSQAISFAKEQNDSDLWEDLLNYSMDKPRFIRGLLEEVGTAIDPVTLVRRIPEGLEIEGLREGLSRMIKEHEIQYSISSGVAKVLKGEVSMAQNTLRSGQRKGVKFDILHKPEDHVDIQTSDAPPGPDPILTTMKEVIEHKHRPPSKAGHCVGCQEPFSEHETETLVGFACGHVFHLSHLLNYENEARPPTPPDLELDDNGEWAPTHSIVVAGVGVFGVVNHAICWLLNGEDLSFVSDPKFAAKRKEYTHEQWIFLNGVAVGSLKITFVSLGIPFDLVQVLLQRILTLSSPSLRTTYNTIKHTLYNPSLKKVILILHSQGGIEGSLILDMLLSELPQDLLSKLEIYTFGNAANHFNNPHLHLSSLEIALAFKSKKTYFPSTSIRSPGLGAGTKPKEGGKTIHYIEHYTHTQDFVAQWGVLHFINPPNSPLNDSPDVPRFMGRVFESEGRGHQFGMHYLDSMFPLKAANRPKSPNDSSDKGKGGIGESGFEGADEENDFINDIVEFGSRSPSSHTESLSLSALTTSIPNPNISYEEVGILDESPISSRSNTFRRGGSFDNGLGFTSLDSLGNLNGGGIGDGFNGERKKEYRVRDLSRLWRYRNGRCPEDEQESSVEEDWRL
ncbi:hypothetical protein G7Y89_g2391 [Cudoniella acicularis]|uniref:Vps41 beta-propeller domain-containing protein n=1 Tax=Cudoniella acicularis TaxID=354080 RepID=A0A8H4RV69_9HELO|nr:hypothetical protein G7Y89_g2391 [Cudoniella acicularis]